jgi:NADPH:quinone reductase-like Zn-dependent oxidoreductase
VGGVVAGETVVVTGASGGLGIAAAQIAHALGARVLGVTTSASKVADLGAYDWLDAVLLDDGGLPIDDTVRALTDDAGADVIVDTVGGQGVRALVRSLARCGRLVLLGQVDASEASMAPAEMIFREARIAGSLGVERSHVERAIELATRGQLTPVVDRELGLSADAVGEALTLLRERAVTGRVVLAPRGVPAWRS